MDKPISNGDLVEVIKPGRCNCCHSLGRRFTVANIDRYPQFNCSHCRAITKDGPAIAQFTNGEYCELSRLKRIDPPALPESVEHKESLTA